MVSFKSKRLWFVILSVSIVGPALALRPAMNTIAGITAHTVCSDHFITGLKPERVYNESLGNISIISDLRPVTSQTVDEVKRFVKVSVMGLFSRTAYYTPATGCTLFESPRLSGLGSAVPAVKPVQWDASYANPNVNPAGNAAIERALDQAFAENQLDARRNTRAIIVVKGGRIIAERYAEGISINSPMVGYSLSKSVNNTLFGLMARKGMVNVMAPAPIAEWQGAKDPRKAITTDQLLRMTSGLDIEETHSGWDPVTQMLYSAPDMTEFSRKAKLVKPVGTHFAYSSESTVLTTGIARDKLGSAAKVHQFLQQELLDPLSMRSAFFESDATGLPIGGSYFYASARDWSKLGQLYLYNGALQGRAFLPPDWMAYSTKRTLNSGYGAGFWHPTDAAGTPDADLPKLPAGSFAGLGYLGQLIIVIPSRDMVILRFAASNAPDGVENSALFTGMDPFVGQVLDPF